MSSKIVIQLAIIQRGSVETLGMYYLDELDLKVSKVLKIEVRRLDATIVLVVLKYIFRGRYMEWF
jgi:hypothetical protein